MNTFILVTSSIISSVLLGMLALKMWKAPIKIRYKLNPYDWFLAHIVVYFFTLIMMLCADTIYYKFAEIEFIQMGLKGVICLFVQNGGLIIFVMVGSSWIYNQMVRIIEFHYFIERHLMLRKIFFSLVCISLAVLYIVEGGKSNHSINILESEYKLITIWLIVLFQIWIGFGMKTDFLKYIKQSLHLRFKNNKSDDFLKEENKNIIFCLISMVIVPIMTVLFFALKDSVSKNIIDVFVIICWGVVVGLLFVIITLLIFVCVYRPSVWCSIRKINKFFTKVQKSELHGYFMRVNYKIKRSERGYDLVIHKEALELDDKINFSEEYIDEINNMFDKKDITYSREEYDEQKIKALLIEELLSVAEKRQELLRKGFSDAHELCMHIEKYK